MNIDSQTKYFNLSFFQYKDNLLMHVEYHHKDKKVARPFVVLIGIYQFHRCGRPQAACHEPAGSYDKTTRTAICFEHKTQYL